MSVAQNSYFQELVAAVQTVFHVLMWALRNACLRMHALPASPRILDHHCDRNRSSVYVCVCMCVCVCVRVWGGSPALQRL